jgi:hypothetical protein
MRIAASKSATSCSRNRCYLDKLSCVFFVIISSVERIGDVSGFSLDFLIVKSSAEERRDCFKELFVGFIRSFTTRRAPLYSEIGRATGIRRIV